MKKTTTLSIIIFLFYITVNAQWVAVGSGMDNYVWGSAVYNGDLYACGNFEHADGNQALAIAKWNGSAWSDVGGGFQHGAFSYAVRGLIVFNGELYAGGYVDSVAGMPIHKVAKWNGTSWSAVGMNCPISTVSCFAVHNGELYAGGQGSGLVKVCVAKWDGANWIGLDVEAGNTDVYALASYNGDLYAGGAFTNFNGTGAAGVAKWNGNTWSDIGSGFSAFNAVRALAVFNNKLYIGGGFTTAGGVAVNNIVAWDGSSWTPLNGGVNSGVQSLLSYGGKLFVGGMFWMVNGITANRAAYWDGSSWTILGTDLGSGAKTIAIYNNELYYGDEGAFNGHNYIAKWGGGIFTGIEESEEKVQFSFFPNPVSEKLFVSSKAKAKNLVVSDIFGKRMNVAASLSNGIAGVTEINVSDLTSGIYFLSTENNSSNAVKFVVQR